MADVETSDGQILTIYCPNTGSMKNCLYPGRPVWFWDSENPKRIYPCTWELAEIPVLFDGKEKYALAGLNTGRANRLVDELLSDKKGLVNKIAPELSGYGFFRTEVRYGKENSRIDFMLQQNGLPDCFVEVKSVTLAVGDGLGLFPDAVTSRGSKHLRELMAMTAQGHKAMLLFCVQHTGIDRVAPAADIDPDYATTLQKAIEAGVEVIALGADITLNTITLTRRLDVSDHFAADPE